jgi:hypothetical protein
LENIFNIIKWMRLIDDQPPELAVSHCGEFRGNDLEVPVHHQLGLRVELLKAIATGFTVGCL